MTLNLAVSEAIDTREAAGHTISEANRRATARKCLEDHRKLDSVKV